MKIQLIILFIYMLTFQLAKPQEKIWNYPQIKADTAIDAYHGKKILDPFRNLEDSARTEVKSWMLNQNQFYDNLIDNITGRDSLLNEIINMRKKQKIKAYHPRAVGNRLFYPMGYLDDNIDRLVYIDSINQKPIELFNTKEINERTKSTYTIDYFEPSFNGKYLAFGISPNGTEKASIYIIDVEKKQLLSEIIEHSRGGNIQWLPDCSGFFYLRNKEIITEEDKKSPYQDIKISLHKLYTDSKSDKEVFSRLINKALNIKSTDWPVLFTFPSSDKVLVNILDGKYCTIYYGFLKDLLNLSPEEIKWRKICGEDEMITTNFLFDNYFWGLSFKNNSNGQIIIKKLPDLTSKVLFDANDFYFDDMVSTKKNLYATVIENGLTKIIKINPKNFKIENLKFPFSGDIRMVNYQTIVSNYLHSDNLIFTLSSYTDNRKVYVCDLNNKITDTGIVPTIQFTSQPLELVVEETEVPSHDGVKVPLTIVYKKGIKFDGSNPTFIEAYGAYGISMKPLFVRNRLAWFNHGGIYVVAHVRGGLEKGDDWYKGGFKATKPNCWKDLIACSEFLIKNKYTSPKNLAVKGASAGAITVGRAITERPDLYKAAIIFVGNLNTIRMESSNGEMSTTEFGTVKDSLEFEYLRNMDTYHHIIKGVKYPSIMFSGNLNDARVVYWESAKTVAKLQNDNQSENIILYRIEDKGHFNYPSDTDTFSFLFWQLGHPDFKLKEKSSMFRATIK